MAALLAVLQAAQSLEERFTYGSLRFISRVFGVVKPLERSAKLTEGERNNVNITVTASEGAGQPTTPEGRAQPSSPTAESSAGQTSSFKTPPSEDFAAWLSHNKPSQPLSHQEARDFVDLVPLSTANKDFLRSNLRRVPEVGEGEFNCPLKLNSSIFPRPDFLTIFEDLYDEGCNICVAQGLRRLGKSVFILEAVLAARARRRGSRDKVVFFWDGNGEWSNFKSIFAVLNCMGVLTIIDEFQDHPAVGRDIKTLVEAPGFEDIQDPLQFVFYGSNQQQVVHELDKYLYAVDGAGVKVVAITLPPASTGLLHSIMVHNKQAPPLDPYAPSPGPKQKRAPLDFSTTEPPASQIGSSAKPHSLQRRSTLAAKVSASATDEFEDTLARIIVGAFEGNLGEAQKGSVVSEEAVKSGEQAQGTTFDDKSEQGVAEGALKLKETPEEEAQALELLQRITLGGFDMKLHHREAIPSPAEFAKLTLSRLLYAEGRDEGILRRLMEVSKELHNVEREVVGNLVAAGLIREVPTGGRFEFVEPRLLSLSYLRKHKGDPRKLSKTLETVEGKVFEKLVQSDPDLEAALFSMLNINSDDIALNTYGTISKDSRTGGAEVDRLVYETNKQVLTLISAKRDRRQQKLKDSFLDHIMVACENVPPLLEEVLPHVRTLRLVAVSAKSTGVPFALNPHNLRKSNFHFKEEEGTYSIAVSLNKQEEQKKKEEKQETGPVLTWKLEAQDILFADVLKNIPTPYPASKAVQVV